METIIDLKNVRQLVEFQNSPVDVLFIDNDIASYLLAMELLAEHNINVIHSRSGMKAINIFKANQSIGVIITELLLPFMNGFEVLKEIRRINPAIPVIVQTAHVVNNMQHTCINAGFSEFIDKPINLEVFTLITVKYARINQNPFNHCLWLKG